MSALTEAQTGAILASSRNILLDFDGPVCSIFAGRAAPVLANEIVRVVERHGIAVPTHVLASGDPSSRSCGSRARLAERPWLKRSAP